MVVTGSTYTISASDHAVEVMVGAVQKLPALVDSGDIMISNHGVTSIALPARDLSESAGSPDDRVLSLGKKSANGDYDRALSTVSAGDDRVLSLGKKSAYGDYDRTLLAGKVDDRVLSLGKKSA